MITLEQTDDLAFVRSVFTHPKVWPFICDDGMNDPELYQPVNMPGVVYVMPRDAGLPMGCLMLVDQNAVTMELHSALLPQYRGAQTAQVFRALLAWLPEQFPGIRRLRTWVPGYNRPALVAARRVGFEECGKEPNAYLKDGALSDLHLFGVSFKCPQFPS